MDTFYIVEAALILGPVFGFTLRRWLKRAERRRQLFIYAALTAVLLMGGAIWLSPLSFRGIYADATFCALAYLAYCGLVFAVVSVGPIRKIAFALLAMPIVLGTVAATIGSGAVALISYQGPMWEEWLNPRYSCRYTLFGAAFTDGSGVTVALLYHPRLIPLVEWRSFSRDFDTRGYGYEAVRCYVDPGKPDRLTIEAPPQEGQPERGYNMPPERVNIPLN